MKIKYTGKVQLTSQGITFQEGLEYDLKDEQVDYLLKTFKGKFIVIKKVQPKQTPKAEKPTRSRKKPQAEDKE